MCDPVTIATTAAVASAGASIYQGVASNKLAGAQADAEAEQARAESMASAERASRIRLQGQKFLAEQRVAWNTSGVEGSTGSALEVGKADAAEIELDALTEMYGGQNRRKALLQQAAYSRASGRMAQTAGFLNAAADILGAGKTWESLSFGGGGGGSSTDSYSGAGSSSRGSRRSGGL